MLDRIETNIEDAVDYAEKARQNVKDARDLLKKARKVGFSRIALWFLSFF